MDNKKMEYNKEDKYKMKWWGWGEEDINYPLDDHIGIAPYLNSSFGITHIDSTQSFSIDQHSIPESGMPNHLCETFYNTIGKNNCYITPHERLIHATGKSYKDLLELRGNCLKLYPDMVVYPESEKEISRVIKISEENQVAIVPFGGGTSVVGGLQAIKGPHKYIISMDLRRLDKVISINDNSMTAEVQAGIFGPQLEDHLNQKGYTLGHFPQSFEFSTLGGWIATRSSGQNSLLYGGIEKLVRSIKIVTPIGTIQTLNVPRMACGPDIKELILGSEGILGIITQANVKITPLPEEKRYQLYIFRNFIDASKAAQKVVQCKLRPAMLRVSDEDETKAMMAMGKSEKGVIKKQIESIFKKYLSLKGFKSNFSTIMLGLEGKEETNQELFAKIHPIFTSYGGQYLGTTPGKKWLKERFILPYYRDQFMNCDLLVDTLETVADWNNLLHIYNEIKNTIKESLERPDIPVEVYTHISHLYPDGASLYFSIIAKQDFNDPLAQWQQMKDQVNLKIKSLQTAISHHHGIGMDHKNGLHFQNTETIAIQELKRKLDPHEVMNPGKLL